MDMADAIAPDSEQLDAVDLIGGPRTFRIVDVKPGSGMLNGRPDKRPIIWLEGFPRPWRPGKYMSRVLADKNTWGKKGSTYIGKRITLYRDPDVTIGKEKVGGTRVSHMSDLTGPVTVDIDRGKKHTVHPLPDAPTDPTPAQIAAATTPDELRALWESSSKSPEMSALVKARKAEMDGATS